MLLRSEPHRRPFPSLPVTGNRRQRARRGCAHEGRGWSLVPPPPRQARPLPPRVRRRRGPSPSIADSRRGRRRRGGARHLRRRLRRLARARRARTARGGGPGEGGVTREAGEGGCRGERL